MADKWNYFLMRTNTGDAGDVPGPAPAYASPDIIPWGTQDPPADPARFFVDNYGTAYDNELVVGQPNRIFMRARNLNAARQEGEMALYWSKAAFILWPTGDNGWSNNIISTASGKDSVAVAAEPNAVVVGTDPFLWSPQPLYGDHYCLIGGVRDARHPLVPELESLNDFAGWVLRNRNVGWHNTRITNTGSPQWSETSTFSGRKGGGKVRISVIARNCPIGWKVRFECYTPDKKGFVPRLEWVTVDNETQFGRFLEMEIGEGYQTAVWWGVQFHNIQPTRRWEIAVEFSYLTRVAPAEAADRLHPARTGRLPAHAALAAVPVYEEVIVGGRGVLPG
jgi:hypothetical protein